mmetsp:Transcript_4453/g.6006  ORF Transcript_4453/g.6006 Transcript_4453/m.6006 type:complete len:299 (-) Transcript_4453:113-1009(-)|eukprot:CAMPEP_0196572132 /NCGR_PEP_ID=MMETSP1081-20130531/2232_1 /TAXON_ID=36882 /ORGANISM="Pyramimonas amylifera, Strain CCMP720" /LENGTH=298 /DNA_ID=CAMNT_0041889339 /DNA_START=30 /DNA_END=926 /DNA_ORIENTATION=-
MTSVVTNVSTQRVSRNIRYAVRGATRLTPLFPASNSRFDKGVFSQLHRRKKSSSVCSSSYSNDDIRHHTTKTTIEQEPTIAQQVETMRIAMNDCVVQQIYSEAAKIRDAIIKLEETDPLISATKQLKLAVITENFEDAARLREDVKKLTLESLPKFTCSSDTLTHGVRVSIQSMYVAERSDPSQDYHFFAYRITITNESPRTVHLLNRQWVIQDGTGKTELVSGPGVVGQQPILHPGGSFEYTSACPLMTPNGTMEGSYEMRVVDDPMQHTFSAKAGRFGLDIHNREVVITNEFATEL